MKTDSISIVKEIREIKSLDKVPILFVTDTFAEETLLYAFDNGIDDFFFMEDEDSVILMRIFLTLQKSILYKQIEINEDILISANIIDKDTGIYTKDNAALALKHFISRVIEENQEKTILMYIKPIAKENRNLNLKRIGEKIKKIPRTNDIVAFGKSAGFYLLLFNCGVAGAESVTKRIQQVLINDCYIYANAAEVTKSFEEMEPVLYQSMKEQIDNDEQFNYIYSLSKGEIPDEIVIKDETGKEFKDFKKEFFNGFEKITSPVFYKLQNDIKEQNPEIEIKYNMTETESNFSLIKAPFKNVLKITYPAYIKVIIDIIHYNEDKQEEVKRLTYDFEDFSEEKLTNIIEEMYKDIEKKGIISTLYPPEETNE